MDKPIKWKGGVNSYNVEFNKVEQVEYVQVAPDLRNRLIELFFEITWLFLVKCIQDVVLMGQPRYVL